MRQRGWDGVTTQDINEGDGYGVTFAPNDEAILPTYYEYLSVFCKPKISKNEEGFPKKRTSIFGNHKGYRVYPSLALFFQFGAEMLDGTVTEKENAKSLINELWNSKYVVAVGLLLMNLRREEDVDLPEQFGDFWWVMGMHL